LETVGQGSECRETPQLNAIIPFWLESEKFIDAGLEGFDLGSHGCLIGVCIWQAADQLHH